MKKISVVASTFLLALASIMALGATASAQTIKRVVFFGDSLSDPGNHFIYFGTSSRQPFPFGPPEASYDIGGHHFSNGNTWAEQLATALHLPGSGSPALRQPGVFTNYAVGRARARAGAPVFPDFDLGTQVNRYFTDFAGQPKDGTLFVIWIGGNDMDDALSALASDPSGATSVGILQAALQAVITNIELLYGAGGRMFLVPNLPNLASTPYLQFLGANVNPALPAIATLFNNFYDGTLASVLSGLPGALPPDSVHPLQFIRVLDVNALFTQLLATPQAFGLRDTTDRCLTPDVVAQAICSTPQRYLFWDAIHPTNAAHTAVGQAALQILPAQ